MGTCTPHSAAPCLTSPGGGQSEIGRASKGKGGLVFRFECIEACQYAFCIRTNSVNAFHKIVLLAGSALSAGRDTGPSECLFVAQVLAGLALRAAARSDDPVAQCHWPRDSDTKYVEYVEHVEHVEYVALRLFFENQGLGPQEAPGR